MPERAYLSIGEVLALLRPEFADLTISKIRFLESQGLLDPERTPSGYRKFYEPDVERLRWIPRQQREQYLPLKVIKGRLGVDEGDDGGRAVALAEAPAKAADDEDTAAPASSAESMTHSTMAFPQTGCRTLGVWDRMRVPRPAAIMRTVNASGIGRRGYSGRAIPGEGFEPSPPGPKPGGLPTTPSRSAGWESKS